MYVPYECCAKKLEDFYINQAGNGLSYYQGQTFQKGYGIGGWFKSLFRTALPYLTKGIKSVGKEVIRTGTNIAGDMLEGKNFKDSINQRSIETGKTLAKKAIHKAQDMLGKGKKYKRKRKVTKKFISLKHRKLSRRDIFDS